MPCRCPQAIISGVVTDISSVSRVTVAVALKRFISSLVANVFKLSSVVL